MMPCNEATPMQKVNHNRNNRIVSNVASSNIVLLVHVQGNDKYIVLESYDKCKKGYPAGAMFDTIGDIYYYILLGIVQIME